MFRICIRSAKKTAELGAAPGEQLLSVLRRAGFSVSAPCGGNGTCGKCRVLLLDAEGARTVSACRTLVMSPCTVLLDELTGGSIAADGDTPALPGGGEGLTAALDLGTTTLALALLERSTGKQLGLAAAWNAQAAYGADVISRAQYCMEYADGVETLRRVIREQVHELLRSLGAEPEALSGLYVAGNTIMQHLFAGLDPSPLARAPFTPQTLFDDGRGDDDITYAPCVAAYVGGDITAGLLASGLYERDGIALYLDIGTNGEMALGGAAGFVCCAVASGPAFEGAGIRCGMPALDGAIRRVAWDGETPAFEVIGGGEARGLCGSGLIDLLAVLCRKRIVTGSGLLLGPVEAPPEYARYLSEDENGNGVFHLTERVFLTASDVRALQLAKAAVAAGIRVLLKKSGLEIGAVARLVLAGGFGGSLSPESAAAIGMLPAELTACCEARGNLSLHGARMAALDPDARDRLREIQRACRYIELSGDADFNCEYPDQMFFYEDDEEDDEWN